MVAVNIPSVALNNGRVIPILGLGTWKVINNLGIINGIVHIVILLLMTLQ